MNDIVSKRPTNCHDDVLKLKRSIINAIELHNRVKELVLLSLLCHNETFIVFSSLFFHMLAYSPLRVK